MARWRVSDRPQSRLTIAIVMSILIHGLILSLQSGIQGIGLPGLALPWNERRAPELSIHLANVKAEPAMPVATEKPMPPQPVTGAELVKPTAPSASDATPTSLEMPDLAWRPHFSPKISPPEWQPNEPPRNPIDLSTFSPQASPLKEPRQKIMALDEPKKSTFTVPLPELLASAPLPASTPEPTSSSVENNPPAILDPVSIAAAREKVLTDLATQKIAEEARQQQALALEKKALAESIAKQQAAADQAKILADEAVRQMDAANALQKTTREAEKRKELETALQIQAIAAKKLDDDKKQEQAKAEENVRKQALALALEKQQQAAIKVEREEAAKRALEVETQKLAEIKKEEEAKAEREIQKKLVEAERRKQAEIQSQMQAQIQVEKQASEQKAQAMADRQKAEAAAAKQRDQERLAAENLATAQTSAKGIDKPGESGAVAGGLSTSGLVNRSLQQPRKIDLTDASPVIPKSSGGALEDTRRRTFFGDIDKDVGMKMYIDSWRQKIERNGSLNYAQSSRERARGDMVVNIAIRSDGSVENITIVRSSGRRELDDAVRRIVKLNARYSAFPPNLARQYDVVEIRRIWAFEDSLRIVEEVH